LDISLFFDKYVTLQKEEAYSLHSDEKNYKIFRRVLITISIILCIIFLISILEKGANNTSFFVFLFVIPVIFLFIFLYRRIFNISNIRKSITYFFISILIFLCLISIASNLIDKPKHKETTPAAENKTMVIPEETQEGLNIKVSEDGGGNSPEGIIFIFGIILLFFRLSRNEIIQFYLMGFGIPVIINLTVFKGYEIGGYIFSLIISAILFFISYTTAVKRRKNFFRQFDFYHKKHFENIRMKKELDYARDIQLSMLPERECIIGDLQIAGVSLPASEVGGDYFDYFKISDTQTAIFICDVSGHGVASALLLSGLRSCMHLILEETTDPVSVFQKLNRMIRKTQNRKMFVTAVFALIDTEKNLCRLFNAGHLPPYKISGDSYELLKLSKHGITLGAVDEIESFEQNKEITFEFKKNDILILYTDGIVEGRSRNNTEYGFDRLESFIYSNIEKKPKEILDNLLNEVNKFSEGASLIDDISVLIIGRN